MKKTYLSKTRLLFGIVSLLLSTVVSAQNFTVSTFAGSGTSGNTNGTGTSASFNFPYGVAVDANRTVYVADRSNNLIRKITAAGEVSTLASGFSNPSNVAVDKLGNVYVADVGNACIKKIAPNGTVTTFAGSSNFSSPRDLTVDAQGNVYVTDYIGAKVLKITSAGVVSTVAGSGTQATTDGNGINASFFGPTGIAVDANGVIYVAELNGNTIRKIATNGDVTTLAGAGTSGFADGTGNAAKFAGLYQLSIAPDGNLYAADFNNRRFRKITPAGVVSTLAGTGTAGSTDGLSTSATFAQVTGIAAFNNSYFVVSDYGNHKIRTVTSCTNTSSTTTISSCDAYTWDGTTYTTSGTYTKKMLNATGCDSIATLNLTINKATHNVSTQTACESYTWNGTTYTTSGTYTFSYNNANGCASVDTLKLTINKGTHQAEKTTICDSYTWNGTTYTNSGTYTFSYNNANGCTSVDTLHLIIKKGVRKSQQVTTCGEFSWNEATYNESGVYTNSYSNEDGCTNVDTLKLSIKNAPKVDIMSNYMYNSCNETIEFTASADSSVFVNDKKIETSSLIAWSSEYYDYSSTYGSGFNPNQATSAPNTPYGDNEGSWATESEDDPNEFITLYYDKGVIGNKVLVYQNFNPGAITKVEVSTTKPNEEEEPTWITIANPTPAAINTNKVEIAEFPYNLNEPVYLVKVSLASDSVPGYNEIDAVGIVYSGYKVEKAKSIEYSITAFNKGGCSYTTTFENQNGTQYDTLTLTSCNAYHYSTYDREEQVTIAKTGVYDFDTFPSEESSCRKRVHLNFTYTGTSSEKTVNTCKDEEGGYFWEEADRYISQSGDFYYTDKVDGCDNVYTLHLTLKNGPQYNPTPFDNNCHKLLTLSTNADSSVFVNNKIVPRVENESYLYQLDTLKNKEYTIKMFNKNGCSTTINWENVTAISNPAKYVSSCGDYITDNNKVLSKSGTYKDTTVNSSCDVINTIEFTNSTPVNNVVSFTDKICVGKPLEVTVQDSQNAAFYYLSSNTKTDIFASTGLNVTKTLSTSYNLSKNDTIILFSSNNTAGDAAKLEKSNDHIRFENISLPNNNAITVEADVYFEGNNFPWAGQSQYNSDNMSTNSWLWHSGSFLVNSNGNWKELIFPSVNKTGWVHVATVANEAGMAIYYDGEEVASNEEQVSGIVNNANTNLVIGADPRYPNNGGRNSNNAYDNFAIWTEARTQTQINSDRNSCLEGTEANLLFYSNFNNINTSGVVATTKGPSGQFVNSNSDFTTLGTSHCNSLCTAPVDTLIVKVGNNQAVSSISGKVTINSYPASQGKVVLYQVNGEGVLPTAVDTVNLSTGNYLFNNLAVGEYKLRFDCGTNCGAIPTYYNSTTKYKEAQSVMVEGCPNSKIENINFASKTLAIISSGNSVISGTLSNGNVNSNVRIQTSEFANVLVQLIIYPSGNVVKFTYTDENGNYSFSNLPNGDYKILADVPGYNSYESDLFTVNGTSQVLTTSLCANKATLEIGSCSIITNVNTTEFQLSVAPNPSAGLFNISTNVGDATYRVINSVGVEVFSKQITGNTTQIDLSSQADGIYILQVISDNKLQQAKLVKE